MVPALAHEGNPEIRVALDEPPPALAGMDIAVVTSVTEQLVLSNPSGKIVEVLDDDGTAFLRIGPRGVDANLNAAAWYLTNNPLGSGAVPQRARVQAPPAWARVAVEPSWGWFDHRLHPSATSIPAAVRNARRPAELRRWSIPLRVSGNATAITGSIRYQPLRGAITADITRKPDIPGLVVGALPGRVPGLFLENRTGGPVIVLGSKGEPFLRFRRGRVEANRHSPSWLSARRAETGDAAGVVVDASRPPQWRAVSDVPRFGWIEPRAGYPTAEPPAAIADAGQPATLRSWSVPLRVGRRNTAVHGVNAWEPFTPEQPGTQPAQPPSRPEVPLLVLGAVAGGAVLLGLHRSRTRWGRR